MADDISVFLDKAIQPAANDLIEKLENCYPLWVQLSEIVVKSYPKTISEWNFPGAKYGWSYRIKDKKRAIIYFLPREGYFKVAFIFGQKATDAIMESDVNQEIKNLLIQAVKYAEGRGIRIDIKDNSKLADIKKLIAFKLAF